MSSRRTRAVVDLPTATEPATPMTNGVREARSPRNSLEASWSAADGRRVQVEEPGERAIDVVDLGEVDGVSQAADPGDVLLRQGKGSLAREGEPLGARERDERASRFARARLVHASIVAHRSPLAVPRGRRRVRGN